MVSKHNDKIVIKICNAVDNKEEEKKEKLIFLKYIKFIFIIGCFLIKEIQEIKIISIQTLAKSNKYISHIIFIIMNKTKTSKNIADCLRIILGFHRRSKTQKELGAFILFIDKCVYFVNGKYVPYM